MTEYASASVPEDRAESDEWEAAKGRNTMNLTHAFEPDTDPEYCAHWNDVGSIAVGGGTMTATRVCGYPAGAHPTAEELEEIEIATTNRAPIGHRWPEAE